MSKVLMGMLIIASFCLGCKSDKASSDMDTIDLMSHGMPIKIKAPTGAKIESTDLGVMKDITVKGEGNFFLQITSGEMSKNKIEDLVSEHKKEVENGIFFEKFIDEDAQGFTFRKKIDDRTNHDFRYVKFQGDQEYIFQTGLMGQFSLEEVQAMFKAVK